MVIFHSYWTVVVLVVFLGIVVWAWSGKRKQRFERAARIPFEEDQPVARGDRREGNEQ